VDQTAKFGEDTGRSSMLPMHILDFRYYALFQNYGASKLNWNKFCTL